MVLVGLVGLALGILCSSKLGTTVVFLGAPAVVCSAVYGFKRFWKLPLGLRLNCEVSTLALLVLISSITGVPLYYEEQERRCEALALRASRAAAVSGRETRAALEREAAWFTRRAGRLQRRGLWIGLMKWPSTWWGESFDCWDQVHELGVLEGVEMHEMALERCLSAGTPEP